MIKGVGTMIFKRKSGSLLHLKNVMYILGLKKNFVLVVFLEDKGYDVVFNKGKGYLKHYASGQVKQIGVRIENL